MLTDIQQSAKKYGGILLLVGGCMIENLFGPSLIGWGFILFGILFEWVWPNRHFYKIPLTSTVVFLGCLSFLSLWVTADFGVTFPLVNQLVVDIICFWGLICWLQKHHEYDLFTQGLILFGVVLSVASPFIVEWQQNKGGIIPNRFYQQFPILLSDPVHPNIMASIMLMLFPLPLVFSLQQMKKELNIKFWVYGIAATVMLLVLFLTRSRGGYLVGTIGLIMILSLLRFRWLALLASLMSVAAFVWLISFEPAVSETAVNALADTNTVGFRLQVWQLALDMIRDFPFTGVGMGEFNAVGQRLYPYPPFSSPGTHNLYLQVAVELGLPGLITWLIILGYAMRRGWGRIFSSQHGSHAPIFIGALIGVSLMILHGFVDVTVWGTRMSIMIWLMLALLVGKISHLETAQQKRGIL